MNKENRHIKKRNERRRRWLQENGYNFEEQLKIESWCRSNMEVAIEQAYNVAYRSVSWEKIYHQCKGGDRGAVCEIYKRICHKEGIKYFDDSSPPNEYKEIS